MQHQGKLTITSQRPTEPAGYKVTCHSLSHRRFILFQKLVFLLSSLAFLSADNFATRGLHSLKRETALLPVHLLFYNLNYMRKANLLNSRATKVV